MFLELGEKSTGQHCNGMEGIIEEGKGALEKDEEGASFDCDLIGAGLACCRYLNAVRVEFCLQRALSEPYTTIRQFSSGQLGRTGTQHSGGPIRVGKRARGQCLQFSLNIVLDAPNHRPVLIQKQVRCAGIAIVWEADAPGVDQKFRISIDLSN